MDPTGQLDKHCSSPPLPSKGVDYEIFVINELDP